MNPIHQKLFPEYMCDGNLAGYELYRLCDTIHGVGVKINDEGFFLRNYLKITYTDSHFFILESEKLFFKIHKKGNLDAFIADIIKHLE